MDHMHVVLAEHEFGQKLSVATVLAKVGFGENLL